MPGSSNKLVRPARRLHVTPHTHLSQLREQVRGRLFGHPASPSRAQAHSRLGPQGDQDREPRAHGAGAGGRPAGDLDRRHCGGSRKSQRGAGSEGIRRAALSPVSHTRSRGRAAPWEWPSCPRVPHKRPSGPQPSSYHPALDYIISVSSPHVQVRAACPRRTAEDQGPQTSSTWWSPINA